MNSKGDIKWTRVLDNKLLDLWLAGAGYSTISKEFGVEEGVWMRRLWGLVVDYLGHGYESKPTRKGKVFTLRDNKILKVGLGEKAQTNNIEREHLAKLLRRTKAEVDAFFDRRKPRERKPFYS